MIDQAAVQDDTPHASAGLPTRNGQWLPRVLALGVLAALLAALLSWWLTTSRLPGDDSLEAGFARDMIVHHDQAVAMALSIRDRTADPRIKSLATDILLTQENQIGQMLGWLSVWGLPATGSQPPMAWMGEPMPGMMPGMATPEELARFERMSAPAADAEFLRLMIRHHQGAIPMAEAALERSRNDQVQTLARAILVSQQAEISAMEELLQQLAPEATPTAGAAPISHSSPEAGSSE